MKRIIIFFSIIFAFSYHSEAQKEWSLQKCIEYALENNIQIKQQLLNTDLSKANLDQSKASVLPNINGSASHAYNYGRTVDMYTNQFATERVQSNNFYLSGNITVFNGFQILNSIKQNQLNLIASKYDVDKTRNDIALSIASAYLQILFNIELLEITKNQFLITEQQVNRTKILVDAGTFAKGSLLNIEAQASSEELQKVNAENNLTLSYLTLTQMLDLDSANVSGFEIEKPMLNISKDNALSMSSSLIYSNALSTLPEIKSAEIKLKSSEIGLSLARGSLYPNLSLRGSIGTGYSGASKKISGYQMNGLDTIAYTFEPIPKPVVSPSVDPIFETTSFNKQINDNINKSIGLYLTVPIFNNFQTKTNISRAKINIKNAEYNLQLTKNSLNKSIQQAYADCKGALNKYNASLKTVDALEESFKYFQQKFDVGMVNSIDYNDAKNKATKAKSDLLQAKYEYVFRLKILDFYQGKAITL
ncbi:MAG: TolC family protein [Bacteroidetes bacterium]|nr:TolC family protein [Bacteroidota bacterium]